MVEFVSSATLPEATETALIEIAIKLQENQLAAKNLDKQKNHLRERLFELLDYLGYKGQAILFSVQEAGTKTGREYRLKKKDNWNELALKTLLGPTYDRISEWQQVLQPQILDNLIQANLTAEVLGISAEDLLRCKDTTTVPYLVNDQLKEE